MMTMQVTPLGWVLGGAQAIAVGNEAALVFGSGKDAAANVLTHACPCPLRELT